jgi:hypothetical protein
MEAFGSYDYEKPQQLPYTTEYFLKELPLAPTAPIGQLAGQAASFVPLNPAPLVRGAQKLGTMVGEGMAERVATGRPMLPSLLAEPQAAMFAVEPNVPRMNLLDTPPETMTSLLEVKPQAPVSDLGFYSAAEQAALNLQRNKGSGQAFLNDLLKAENVKKDELQWMGVDDFLKEKPNVTKQEVQDFITNNRVDVKEVQLGSEPYQDPMGMTKRKEIFDKYEPEILRLSREIDDPQSYASGNYVQLLNEYNRLQDARNIEADAAYMIPEPRPSKYYNYQLPGGENYREILLTLPEKTPSIYPNFDTYFRAKYSDYADPSNPAYSMAQKDARRNWDAMGGKIEIDDFSGGKVGLSTGNYQSSHFDEPNILAHIRVNDRVDADGKKMLLIEEIQSDWHQAGREKGYGPKMEKSVEAYYETKDGQRIPIGFGKTKEEAEAAIDVGWKNLVDIKYETTERKIGEGVPDAPFKDTWYQLALKRVLKHAADNGYERVGLTTGKQQIGRFSDQLRQNVDEIQFFPIGSQDTMIISAKKDKKNTFAGTVENGKFIDGPAVGKTVEEVFGKSMAKQIAEKKDGIIKGNNLTVGGEGMKKYYDEVYPQFLDKYGKKWNARVGETEIKTGNAYAQTKGIPAKETIRYIDITPEMKGAVSKGQPLFAATPALPLGGLLGEPEKKKELSLLD